LRLPYAISQSEFSLMPQALVLTEFLQRSDPILDVRSPSEFQQGHIPGSLAFPLFSDEERVQIGTTYKKQSRQKAVELGLLLVQFKLNEMLSQASSLLSSHGNILCWRGGMRSGFVARLLESAGYFIATLQGGYKTYRRWAIQRLDNLSFSSLCVLGGLTGSGKTAILQALQAQGEQVIDLEALAKHRGSAFGGIGLGQQPTQEQFENELAWVLERLDLSRPVWIEDESRLIGRCHLPHALYQSILQAPLFYVQRSATERLQILLNQYGQAPKPQLLEAVGRISKRLGDQLTKEVKQFIEQEQIEQAFERLLAYYDKTYQYQITKRQVKYCIESFRLSTPNDGAQSCLQIYKYLSTRGYEKSPDP
jgi:tRNA 2-selenouridine synthase